MSGRVQRPRHNEADVRRHIGSNGRAAAPDPYRSFAITQGGIARSNEVLERRVTDELALARDATEAIAIRGFLKRWTAAKRVLPLARLCVLRVGLTNAQVFWVEPTRYPEGKFLSPTLVVRWGDRWETALRVAGLREPIERDRGTGKPAQRCEITGDLIQPDTKQSYPGAAPTRLYLRR